MKVAACYLLSTKVWGYTGAVWALVTSRRRDWNFISSLLKKYPWGVFSEFAMNN